MAVLTLYDRVMETTTTTGTGTVTLLGAVSRYRSFSTVGNGNQTLYTIVQQNAGTNEWETGIGTYTSSGTTLSRTTVIASSNSNALVSFAAGTKDVFVCNPSDRVNGGYQSVVGDSTDTTGTITLPAWANYVQITAVGAGGGGGGGRMGATSTLRGGGNGGGGGGRFDVTFKIVDLAVSVLYYSVGKYGATGGGGGANTDGTNGGDANPLFVNLTNSGGRCIITTLAASGGTGGSATTPTTGGNGGRGQFDGIAGSGIINASGPIAVTDSWGGGGGGGAGGFVATNSVAYNGATGGNNVLYQATGGGGGNFATAGVPGAPGSDGAASLTNNPYPSSGGGGGGGGRNAGNEVGGHGGAGGDYGGGGGGGGGCTNTGAAAGTGGRGGKGIAVFRWFV